MNLVEACSEILQCFLYRKKKLKLSTKDHKFCNTHSFIHLICNSSVNLRISVRCWVISKSVFTFSSRVNPLFKSSYIGVLNLELQVKVWAVYSLYSLINKAVDENGSTLKQNIYRYCWLSRKTSCHICIVNNAN